MKKQPHHRDKRITDIWFTTPLSLENLEKILNLTETWFESENVWEWVVGKFAHAKGTLWLNISRNHHFPAQETETRMTIDYQESLNFTPAMTQQLSRRLLEAGITPISKGKWQYIRGS